MSATATTEEPSSREACGQVPLSLDIVIPLYNEEAVIPMLIQRLEETFSLTSCAEHHWKSLRVIFVDDGSTDATASIIQQHIKRGFPGLLLRLSRNFGHQPALSAGLDATDADMVAILDADLQDPPELIHEMAAKLREGYDVAFALRRQRKDSLLKRVGCWAFYRLVAMMSEITVPMDSGDFCLMRRRVVLATRALPEQLRFQRVLRAWVGFRQVGVEYNRPTRAAGMTKYSWKRLYRLATDGIASASIRPLRLAQVLASFCFLLSILVIVGAFVFRDYFTRLEPNDLLLVVLAVTVAGFGLLMLCIYILGAYVGRMYLEVKARPSYFIMERIESVAPNQGDTH